ncbi:unannotated protein [freshwater metagenome]|uniref:Unannotated protein n=1 Tax=freshwater metagenome TaxID=449393 RepID=A0A6J6YRY0_9ZZZZ|nr:hypothetical protein [Actinomycetota bacterium]MSX70387.1 hypothetical protein [Actinomycetota bacterium]
MEILKFDESGTAAPSRKRSGRGAILVAFVAVVFGASTALASGTLTINNNDGIELAQGVQQTTQCDTDVTISMDSALVFDDPNPSKFFLHGISVSDIADNCLEKTLRLKVYSAGGEQQSFCTVNDIVCFGDEIGTFIEGTPTPGAPGFNTLNFTFDSVLEIADEDTAKSVTIETISAK